MSSKNELLRIIDEQKSQLELYETKLKDLIRAYKGVTKEKVALEQTLQALSATAQEEQIQSEASDSKEDQNEDNESVSSAAASSDQSSKLAALQKALATLTKEKTRTEQANVADKKRMIEAQENWKAQATAEKIEWEKTKCLLEQQLSESRANLRQAQCERECEQSDHAAMIKEFQQKIAQERMQAESYNTKIQSLTKQVKEYEDAPFEYREKIGELTSEVNALKQQLQAQEKLAPNLFQLQKEMKDLKTHYQNDLSQEQIRTQQSQQRVSQISTESEKRVNTLELKIQELSSVIGDYERSRQSDLSQIEKLRARISQLDSENTALSQAASFSCIDNLDYEQVVQRIKQLTDKLGTTPAPVGHRRMSLYELLNLESPEAEGAHEKCRRDYEQLHDEYEKYKLRAQARLKSVAQQKESSGSDNGEVEHLRGVVASLQNKLTQVEAESTTQEMKYQETVAGLRHTIAQLQTSQEKTITEAKMNSQSRINECERQMAKQRERTLELLAEKERELEALRMSMGSRTPTHPTDPMALKKQSSTSQSPQISPHSLEDGSKRSSSESEHSVPTRASPDNLTTLPMGAQGETPNVYYREELAKKEKGASQLRQQVRALESAMRDLQHSAVTKDLRHFDTIEKLKEEIRAMGNKLRLYQDDANLEYLKNVIIKYMMCDDMQGKEHMLKAIANLLKLSNREMDEIRKHNAKWGWPLK